MATRTKKEKPVPGADDLVRESAGTYRTGDGRFGVEKSDVGWYLVDTQQANEFGQQLIHGPLPTLDAVRSAIPAARDIKPLLRVHPTKTKPPTKGGQPAKAEPPPAPPSWIDQLPANEAAQVRQLIRALEKEGLSDAEELVRRHRDDALPLIATRLVEHRLRALVDDQPEPERERARQIVRNAIEILATQGANVTRPAPRWALIEVPADEDLPRNRIRPEV
jgi:hypothetical protein